MISLFKDFFRFARTYRKFWILPFVFLLFGVGGLIVLIQTTAIAPFIYALF